MAKRVIVIGAGIVGAAIGYQLARAGIKTSILDQSMPASGASGRSFGWINASFYVDEAHHKLRAAAMEAWRRIDAEGVTGALNWAGCLCWENTGAALAAQHQNLRELGYPSEILVRDDIHKICPDLPKIPDQALWFPSEGAADTSEATLDLLRAAVGQGAEVTFGMPVERLQVRAGQVCGVETPAGTIEADTVVLANGTGAPTLAAQVGINMPLLSRPGVLFWTRPVAKCLNPVMVAPEMEFRQLADGRFVAPTVAGHQSDDTSKLAQTPQLAAANALDKLRRITGLGDLRLEATAIGWRPVPQDGLPIIGASSIAGAYLAVMHSGVTLAAGVAECVAKEIDGVQTEALSSYRPARFVQT